VWSSFLSGQPIGGDKPQKAAAKKIAAKKETAAKAGAKKSAAAKATNPAESPSA
jgi:hypothetical protein